MTINCKGRLIDVNTPKVMGILNVTPDSFFDGGRYNNDMAVLRQAESMLSDGADFIDIGGYSSRPGASEVAETDEIRRVVPAVTAIVKEFPNAVVSVDTFRSSVARAAIESGAAIVNDISAGNLDADMMETVAALQVPYIMMHMRGNPSTMQTLTDYDDIVKEMLLYFAEKTTAARSFGINDVLIDPGFGFAKTLEQNYEVLRRLEDFSILELPLLVGVSRKSMVYKPLGTSAAEALNGSTVLHTIALSKGAKILRVHDVKEAVEAVKLFQLSQ
ncbi:Dihydropteroate synthase [Flavobacterium longum]|uniref:dihydropteroate synthase n=1 Tax=Flavobacterium longum TaxID=1299340 RepID=UPI0039EAF292